MKKEDTKDGQKVVKGEKEKKKQTSRNMKKKILVRKIVSRRNVLLAR